MPPTLFYKRGKMETIKLDDKPFLIIGSSGQEKELTQDIVNKYNSIAINKSPFNVDIIFRYDTPNDNLTKLDMCRYFCTNIKYKDYEKICIQLSAEDLEVLVSRIYDYTVKLAADNAVELSDDELDLNNGAIINLLSYLKVQKRIFEAAA